MKRSISIFTILTISLAISSCQEDDQTPITIRYLNESIKPYKFMTGSYWIFINDTSGIEDSILVTSTVNDFYVSAAGINAKSSIKEEFFQINLKNFSTSNIYNDYLTISYIKRNGGGFYGQNGQPIYIAESDTGTEFNGMTIIAKYSTFTINSNTFNNVVATKITASQQYQPMFSNDTYLYFCDSIGLIKKVTILGSGNVESWSVLRWSVIK